MKPTTPMRAIRAKCLSCCNESSNEVKLCKIEGCPLWKYRFGHRPKKDGVVGADFSSENIPGDKAIDEGI